MGGDVRGGTVTGGGTDLTSIPGVAGVAVRVDEVDVPIRLGRRPRVRPALAGLLALILVPAGYSATLGDRGDAATPDDTTVRSLAGPAAGPVAAAAAGVAAAATTPVFARFDDLALHLPAGEVLLVGFHEAAYDDALALLPSGTLAANENTTKFDAPADTPEGPGYVVLSSRGRPNPATSAVDLVLRDDVPVRSVVTGTVTDVRPYDLYGRYPDTRIEIRPADRPDLRVVLIHVAGVQVAAGDEVTAGETVLAAGANRFPFASHIDRYTEPDRWPHVHLELKRPG